MSPVSTDDVREGAFEALLQAVAARAGSFQAEHAALGEDFLGYRIRVRGQALSLSHRPSRSSAVVAVHRTAESTRRFCLAPGSWGQSQRQVEATADVLHGHEVEQDMTLAARESLVDAGTVVFQDRWRDHWQDRPHDAEHRLGRTTARSCTRRSRSSRSGSCSRGC